MNVTKIEAGLLKECIMSLKEVVSKYRANRNGIQ